MNTANGYINDLLDQPRALQATLAGLRQQSIPSGLPRPFRRVVLTGMGSSYHAFHPFQQSLIRRGIDTFLVETSELLYSLPGLLQPNTLLIALSQSGRSAEILTLLDRRASQGFAMLGITNTPGSPLAVQADAAVLTAAGEEVTVACKTYIVSLAALAWLDAALANEPTAAVLDDLSTAVQPMAAYLEHMDQHITLLKNRLAGIQDLFIVGRGPSLAAAGSGGLINKEAAHFHAEGMSSAAFRHGPFEMLNPAVYVLVYEGPGAAAPLNRRLYEDVLSAGGKAGLVSTDAPEAVIRLEPLSPAALPLLEILPAQMITLALSALKGHEAGQFSLGTKVTETE